MSTTAVGLADADIVATKPPGVIRVSLRMWRTRVGLLIVAVLAIVALFGRYIAPYGEAEAVGLPFKPSDKTRKDSLFGSANVGHDVWIALPVRGPADPVSAVTGHGARRSSSAPRSA